MLSLSDDQFNVNIKSSLLLKLYLPKGVSINQDNFKQRESIFTGQVSKIGFVGKNHSLLFSVISVCQLGIIYLPSLGTINTGAAHNKQIKQFFLLFLLLSKSNEEQQQLKTFSFKFSSLQSNLSLLSSDIFFFQIFFVFFIQQSLYPNTIDVKRIYNLIFFVVVVKKTPKYRSTYVNGCSYN